MLRLALIVILIILVARAFWRVVDGVIDGFTGRPPRSARGRRVAQMVRDPVCGTFVVPERAVTLVNGRTTISFCSEACRDKYRARTA